MRPLLFAWMHGRWVSVMQNCRTISNVCRLCHSCEWRLEDWSSFKSICLAGENDRRARDQKFGIFFDSRPEPLQRLWSLSRRRLTYQLKKTLPLLRSKFINKTLKPSRSRSIDHKQLSISCSTTCDCPLLLPNPSFIMPLDIHPPLINSANPW